MTGDQVLLIRIEERGVRLSDDIKELKADIKELKGSFVSKAEHEELKKEVATKVSQEEYEPIRKFVYGAIALGLASLGAAVVALVLK